MVYFAIRTVKAQFCMWFFPPKSMILSNFFWCCYLCGENAMSDVRSILFGTRAWFVLPLWEHVWPWRLWSSRSSAASTTTPVAGGSHRRTSHRLIPCVVTRPSTVAPSSRPTVCWIKGLTYHFYCNCLSLLAVLPLQLVYFHNYAEGGLWTIFFIMLLCALWTVQKGNPLDSLLVRYIVMMLWIWFMLMWFVLVKGNPLDSLFK
jgi:hypothetical protein